MRLPIQEIKDLKTINEFLADNHYFCLTIVDGDQPYTVPLNYGYTLEEDGSLCFYVHTSIGGRLYDILHRDEKAMPRKSSFAIVVMYGVLSALRRPCDWDISYRSMIGEGILTEISDLEGKTEALRVLMNCFGETGDMKFPRIDAVTVYKIKVTDYHMKRSKQDFSRDRHQNPAEKTL